MYKIYWFSVESSIKILYDPELAHLYRVLLKKERMRRTAKTEGEVLRQRTRLRQGGTLWSVG